MRTFKITRVTKWIPRELDGYYFAKNHRDAMIQALNNEIEVVRVTNKRFREIERTGDYFQVKQCYARQVTHIFEVIGNQ